MAQRMIIFAPDAIIRLLTHYTDGAVPLDAEVVSAGVSQYLERWVRLVTRSKEWTETDSLPSNSLHLRYTGNKVLRFQKGDEALWQDAPEGPKRQ